MSDNTAEKIATTAPEELDLRSHDIVGDKRMELLQLFPEIQTEGGRIDFDKLKLVLGETVDVGRERYGMNWPGKADCFKTIQQPSLGTLLPRRQESVNFDTTENLFIEGDNLEVLKLLQKSYLGKVKMIYIDPPYNTGNDFIYPDNFAESLHTYLEFTGQVDSEGRKFSTNAETDGRFHSKWLNMMYPRLYLARNLLRDDGVIFISIDDNEYDNLKKLCNEVFGEENFVASIIWEKVYSPKSTAKYISENHDYILLYARSKDDFQIDLLPRTDEQNARYQNPDNDPRKEWKPGDISARNYYSKGTYPITCPGGRVINGPPPGNYWRVSKEKLQALDADGRIWWGSDKNQVPAIKRFLTEVKQGLVPETIWTYKEVGHTQEAKKSLLELFGADFPDFTTPKPVRLIQRMLQISTGPEDIILDFFAGSGTTAQAVLETNHEEGTNRQFILVQLPEPTGRTDLRTIADIVKERIRRFLKRQAEKQNGELPLRGQSDPSSGFKVFALAESSFRPWNASIPPNETTIAQQLELHVEHIRDARTPDDILYELLLKSGFSLSTKVETVTIEGKVVYSIANGAMLICLDRNLTHELINAVAACQPQRVVFLDEGFAGNDQLKTNAVQTMKAKGVTSFRTV